MRRVVLLNSYSTASHALWERGMLVHLPTAAQKSGEEVEVMAISLPGRHWKWRMQASALTLVERLESKGIFDNEVDAFIVTDMMDVGQFRAALPKAHRGVPIVLYFHENQLTFPDHPEREKREWDRHYAFMNLTSALLADAVWFNSDYHRGAFLNAIPAFLKALPAPRPMQAESRILAKSKVVPIGIDDAVFEAGLHGQKRFEEGAPIVVWNHRWEYDKGPRAFYDLLLSVKRRGIGFRLAVLGQSFQSVPAVFDEMRVAFGDRIVHWGHVDSREEYLGHLASCQVALVTAHHDFFGISVLESAAAGLNVVAPSELSYPEHFGRKNLCEREELEAALSQALLSTKTAPLIEQASLYRWQNVSHRAWKCLNQVWKAQ
jgi:glycosyltransferase involved in cell wall biosynthesis